MESQLSVDNVIRIVIVDDHPVVRQGLKEILDKDSRIRVVGLAKNLQTTLHVYEAQAPDVVLMDVAMPDMNGVEVTRALLEKHPEAVVLMLTSYEDDDTVLAALDAGARGYLLKKAEIKEMVDAITATYAGKRSLSPDALEALIRVKTNRKHPDEELTEREMEVLQLMVQGMTNPQIADRLCIAMSTVKFHVGSVFKKLHVSTRIEAVRKTIEEKLIN